jgi:hypothetical protein
VSRNEELSAGMSVGRDTAVPSAVAGANQYSQQQGLVRPNRFDNVLVNIPQAKRSAADYMAAPAYDKAAEPSYRALAAETSKQFDFMTRPRHKGGMGMDVEVTKNDPYAKPSGAPDPAGMMRDVRENNRIKVLSTKTTGGHPFLSDEQNDQFRAVHDVFGHSATGRAFDPHGEEAAFRSHYSMFSPSARPAMASETRAQNSANNYGGLPKGSFVDQKVVTLPSTQLITPIGRRAAFHIAAGQAKRAHERAFGPVNEQPQ